LGRDYAYRFLPAVMVHSGARFGFKKKVGNLETISYQLVRQFGRACARAGLDRVSDEYQGHHRHYLLIYIRVTTLPLRTFVVSSDFSA